MERISWSLIQGDDEVNQKKQRSDTSELFEGYSFQAPTAIMEPHLAFQASISDAMATSKPVLLLNLKQTGKVLCSGLVINSNPYLKGLLGGQPMKRKR